MKLFGLLKTKCYYCRQPIEKGKEIKSEVKVSGYSGVFTKDFCSNEHVEAYNQEVGKKPKSSGGSCCH